MKTKIKESYQKASLEYFGNSNSLHELGLKARKLEEAASNQILEVLNLNGYEVIYTSGNAESYTLIIENLKENETITTNSNELIEISKQMNKTIDKESKRNLLHINLSNKDNLENINKYDYITIEDEIPFFGVLIKKKTKDLTPIIHGGKSTTKYRSGTSPTPLIVSMSKLIKEKYKNIK